MTKRIDLTGRTFGRWTVLEYSGGGRWLCKCACGTTKPVEGGSLRGGKTAGCIKCHPAIGNQRTHGEKRSRLYNIWRGIIARCENPNEVAYPRYGGRGILICPEWRESFPAFRDWAKSNGYDDTLTIDRIDNDGCYTPGNCRWIPLAAQNRNKSRHNPITYNGETLLISELAERHSLPADVVKNRIRRYGWSIERAITTPVLPIGAKTRGGTVHHANVDQVAAGKAAA